MKKIISLLTAGLLALILAVPVFAAETPITVYINGDKIAFPAGTPYLKNNSVLVPFRAVFEKLGLNVLWEPKTGTVTGTSDGLTITLKLGSNRATVNGIVQKLTVAPESAAGTTYVPLRFVAAATGGTAEWVPASRSVQIETPAAANDDEADITALVHLANQYYNAEDAAGFYSLVEPSTGNEEAQADMEEAFSYYDLKDTINSLSVISIEGDEASVYTTETVVRTGGSYIPDQKYNYLYSLVRINGEWKISNLEMQNSAVLLTKEQGMTPAAGAPESDVSLIKNNILQYFQSLNSKNADATLALMTSYGDEYTAAAKSDLEQFLAANDFSYATGTPNVFYYSQDEAAVYSSVTIKDVQTGESYDEAMLFIMYKSGNAWLIDDFYYVD